MRPYEKNFRDFVRHMDNLDKQFYTTDDFPFISSRDMRFLEAMGLIQFGGPCDGALFVGLSDKGVTYFEGRRAARVSFWKNFFSRFISGFLVGIASTMAAAHLAGFLKF